MPVPGMPYFIILSFAPSANQNNAFTMEDASAILPSIPLRINSQTAGILQINSAKEEGVEVEGMRVRGEKLGLEFTKIAFAVTDRGICQCANSSVSDN